MIAHFCTKSGIAQSLASVTVLALALPLPSFAQATSAVAAEPPTADQTVTMEAYTVSGYRQSLAASLDAKRKAAASIDVITAEDVGKFPDTNVAESLSHIPGITVDHLFGQGEKVSILGTDPALNRTLLNGQTVASADWFVLDQPGRTFNYTLLAPEIIGTAEVYKTPEARIDEGSIGGTIILHTRDPFTLRPHTLSGSVGGLYNDRGKKGDFNGSLLYGWHNAAKTLGFVASVQDSREHIRRDGIESYGLNPASDYTDEGSTDPALLAHPDAQGFNSLGTAFFRQTRKRTGGNLAVVFKPTDQFELELNGLYVDAKYDNSNESHYINPAFIQASQTADGAVVRDGVIDSIHFNNAISYLDVQYRTAKVKTQAYDAKATWHGNQWNASLHGGTTKATGGTQQEYFAEFQNIGGYRYNAMLGHPSITFDSRAGATSPALYRFPTDPTTAPNWDGISDAAPTGDKENYGQGDFDFNLRGPLKNIALGVKVRDHTTFHTEYSLAAYDSPLTAAAFSPGLTPSNFLRGITGVSPDMASHLIVDPNAVASFMRSYLPQITPTPDYLFYQNTWSINEKINSAYVQGKFGFDRISGNVGVRAVETKTNSNGYNVNAETNDATATSVTKKYHNFLPSLNVAFDAASNVIVRGSVSKVIARPNYADMTAFLSLDDTTLNGQGGNPSLDPYRATNYDASVEWYFAKNSILSGTVFYKDIQSYILTTSAQESHFNVAKKTTSTYTVQRPHNAGDATSQGYALAFQQTFANDFGVVANYTHVNAQGPEAAPLPYASKHQVTLSPFYENKHVSVRLNYSWRSDYYNASYFGAGVYTRAYTELDASVGYSLTENLKLTVDVLNLLDEEYYAYTKTPGANVLNSAYKEGRRLQAGVHFNF
jgi:iron complex outermembrane receptor protein